MGLLAKVSPAVANADVLLYAVPEGKKASITINLANRTQFAVEAALAVMNETDVALDSATIVTKGSGYTAIPTIVIAGENTTPASVVVDNMALATAPINTSGEGYSVNDELTLNISGATASVAAKVKVLSVSVTGGITAVEIVTGGVYTVLGTSATVTGGTGSNASFSALTWGINAISVAQKGNGFKTNPVLTAPGGTGAAFTTQMVRIAEPDDFFEPGVTISKSSPLERTGIVLSSGQSLYVRAGEANAINAHVWGFETI